MALAGDASAANASQRTAAVSGSLTMQYSWNTLVGKPGVMGSADGSGSAARFALPEGVAVDNNGNVYVADMVNYAIRKVTPAGVVKTLAGKPGFIGSANGTGTNAHFSLPTGVAVDGAENLFVADKYAIRKVTSDGKVTTFAGKPGVKGTTDGTSAKARFGVLAGIAMDASGNVYVADFDNSTIRKVTAKGVVSTLAGSAGATGSTDGIGGKARFFHPSGVAVDGAGNVFVADYYNHTIRKVTPYGVVSTFAGLSSAYGTSDGIGSKARFSGPYGISIDGSGTLYVTDDNTVRKITAAGAVTTIGGSPGVVGAAEGTGAAARFSGAAGVAVSTVGVLYIADSNNDRISIGSFVGAGFVAVGNEYAPGADAAKFASFGGAEINDLGGAAFRGALWGQGVTESNNVGIWYGSTMTMRLLVRTGQAAPGISKGVFAGLGDPVFNVRGRTAFEGWLKPAGTIKKSNATGIWSNTGGSLALIAHAGSAAPGTGANFASFTKVVLPDNGKLTILGNLAHGGSVSNGNDQGIWVGDTRNQLKLILRKGNSASIGGVTKTVASFTALDTPAGGARGFNTRGTLATRLQFTDGQQAVATISQNGTVSAAAWKDGSASGIKNGKFSTFGIPAINESGRTAFRATVKGTGIGSGNNIGIWSATTKSPALVVRTGSMAPGTALPFADFSDPVSNNAGRVAFIGTLPTGSRGVWENTSGTTSLVALAGAQAPDLPVGTQFLNFEQIALPQQAGAIILAHLVLGPGGVTEGNNQGIWAVDTTGKLRLVVRKGGNIVVRGTSKTVTALSIFNATKEAVAQSGNYNSPGDLILGATFSDGTQAIIAVMFQ